MTHESQEQAMTAALERELSAMTAWTGKAPGLWSSALDRSGSARAGGAKDAKRSGTRGLIIAGAASVLVVLLLIGLLMPALGKARSSAPRAVAASASMDRGDFDGESRAVEADDRSGSGALNGMYAGMQIKADRPADDKPGAAPASQPVVAGDLLDSRSRTAPARLVARKVNMDLGVKDVREAFVKAQFLVSEAGGEFVEDSTLSGEGEFATANLTLRIRAERLSETLGRLRELGIVATESSRGEDVTDQAVDLEARLRNEQRVEAELLDLLITRKNAALKDVLDLRQNIGTVRQSIERMIAQRDGLMRRVALSSVLVYIRHESRVSTAQLPRVERGIWDQFAESIGRAWRGGLSALAATVGFIVAVVVGGAIWWVLLLVIVVVVVRWNRGVRRAKAYEPAPVLGDD